MSLFFYLLIFLAAGCFFAYMAKLWKELGGKKSYRFFKFVSFISSLYCFFMLYLTISNTIFLFFLEDFKNSGMSSSDLLWFLFFILFVVPMTLGFKTVKVLTAPDKAKNNKAKNKNKFSA